MKRTPLTRKAPLRAGKIIAFSNPSRGDVVAERFMRAAPLKQKRSTTTPTKAERAHIERVKLGLCMACVRNMLRGLMRADGEGCDAHHLLAGGKRRGHQYTIGLCPWHHRGVRPERYASDATATRYLGPSLAHGSKQFHATYGTDDDLMAMQVALSTN